MSTGNADIFAERTFSNVHVVERIPWPKHGYTASTWDAALNAALSQQYDIALIASEEPQAYTFARAAKIPTRIGFYNGRQKPFKSLWCKAQLTRAIYRSAILEAQPRHECAALFELGQSLQNEPEPTAELARLRPLLLDQPIERSQNRVLQLTSKWLANNRSGDVVASWLAPIVQNESWEATAMLSERSVLAPLIDRLGVPVRLFERAAEWKAAIAGARVLLTPDTGAAHVAGMLGTPVVDIFESADFERNAMRWRPWAAQSRLLAFSQANDGAFGERVKVAVDDVIASTA